MRELLIVTGPPGAGKSTWIAEQFPDATVYDENLNNKSQWRDHTSSTLAILVTAAPNMAAKRYWLEEARRFGFSPRLVVIMPPRSITIEQLHRREHVTNDGKRRRLAKTVQRWYTAYSPHDAEIVIDGRQSLPQTALG